MKPRGDFEQKRHLSLWISHQGFIGIQVKQKSKSLTASGAFRSLRCSLLKPMLADKHCPCHLLCAQSPPSCHVMSMRLGPPKVPSSLSYPRAVVTPGRRVNGLPKARAKHTRYELKPFPSPSPSFPFPTEGPLVPPSATGAVGIL